MFAVEWRTLYNASKISCKKSVIEWCGLGILFKCTGYFDNSNLWVGQKKQSFKFDTFHRPLRRQQFNSLYKEEET